MDTRLNPETKLTVHNTSQLLHPSPATEIRHLSRATRGTLQAWRHSRWSTRHLLTASQEPMAMDCHWLEVGWDTHLSNVLDDHTTCNCYSWSGAAVIDDSSSCSWTWTCPWKIPCLCLWKLEKIRGLETSLRAFYVPPHMWKKLRQDPSLTVQGLMQRLRNQRQKLHHHHLLELKHPTVHHHFHRHVQLHVRNHHDLLLVHLQPSCSLIINFGLDTLFGCSSHVLKEGCSKHSHWFLYLSHR